MLVLGRDSGQVIRIGDSIRIMVVRGERVRIGIEAPQDMRIVREELEADPTREANDAADLATDAVP